MKTIGYGATKGGKKFLVIKDGNSFQKKWVKSAKTVEEWNKFNSKLFLKKNL